jgi:hypothetical protein
MGTRTRISKNVCKGQLVFSTNQIQNENCKELLIEHLYNPFTNEKIARNVVGYREKPKPKKQIKTIYDLFKPLN